MAGIQHGEARVTARVRGHGDDDPYSHQPGISEGGPLILRRFGLGNTVLPSFSF